MYCGFAITPLIHDGAEVGRVLHLGSEVHLDIYPLHHKCWPVRRLLRESLSPIFDEHGFLTTKILIAKTELQRLMERGGFEETWRDNTFIYFMAYSLPFERKQR